jgi:hypothetical protein
MYDSILNIVDRFCSKDTHKAAEKKKPVAQFFPSDRLYPHYLIYFLFSLLCAIDFYSRRSLLSLISRYVYAF